MTCAKLLAVIVTGAALAGATATPASAGLTMDPLTGNYAATTDPPGTDSYTLDVTGFGNCEVAFSGYVTASYASGLGGRASVSPPSFSACSSGLTLSAGPSPWALHLVPVTASANDATIDVAELTMVLGGFVTCRYTGEIGGTHYENGAVLFLDSQPGALVPLSAQSFICPEAPVVYGALSLSPPTTAVD